MSSHSETPDAIPAPVRAVLDLFEGPLAEVQFPDVDHRSLAAGAVEVEQRRGELQAALEAVQVAREELERSQTELGERARKAHAYATVFAAGDAELVEQLAAIQLDGGPKRRGRPRKRKPPRKSQTSLAVAADSKTANSVADDATPAALAG